MIDSRFIIIKHVNITRFLLLYYLHRSWNTNKEISKWTPSRPRSQWSTWESRIFSTTARVDADSEASRWSRTFDDDDGRLCYDYADYDRRPSSPIRTIRCRNYRVDFASIYCCFSTTSSSWVNDSSRPLKLPTPSSCSFCARSSCCRHHSRPHNYPVVDHFRSRVSCWPRHLLVPLGLSRSFLVRNRVSLALHHSLKYRFLIYRFIYNPI